MGGRLCGGSVFDKRAKCRLQGYRSSTGKPLRVSHDCTAPLFLALQGDWGLNTRVRKATHCPQHTTRRT